MPCVVRPSVFAAALVVLASSPAIARAQYGAAKPAVVNAKDGSLAGTSPKGERKLVCKGAEVPAGWALVDDVKDPATCSGNNPAILNTYNVWAIEKIDTKPAGAIVDICASVPVPKGWVLVDIYRDKATCGHPQDSYTANVKRVRKS